MLDLKKSNNSMSFHEIIGAIVFELKKIHTKKRSKGRLKNTNKAILWASTIDLCVKFQPSKFYQK